MKKKLLVLFALGFLSVFTVFAFDGYMTGGKNVRYVRTKWFDIIYAEGSEESAAEIAGCADRIYGEICASLGIQPSFRMPVTITSQTDVFNAYFSNGYYNHIVLFDTLPDEDMAVFRETLTGTFRHELTHAVTINMRNPFWFVMDFIFGDTLNPGAFMTMPTMVKEGASVASESLSGEGRLSDPYYLHMLRQSKLMGKFPSYADVAGARDVYPSGNMSYGFGGPFTEWLQKRYGMEKYAEFWYAGINLESLTYALAFKRTYGLSLKNAWEEFASSVYVPEISENVQVKNLHCKPGAVFSSLCLSGDSAVWFERNSGNVYRSSVSEDGNLLPPEKILCVPSVASLGPSSDPRFLPVCEYDDFAVNLKTSVSLYSLDSRKKIRVEEKSLRNPFVARLGDDAFLCAVQVSGQREKLIAYKIVSGDKGSVRLERLRDIDFPRGEMIFSPCDGGNGRVACIVQDSLVQKVRVIEHLFDAHSLDAHLLDANLPMTFYDIPLPDEKIRIRNLSALGDSSDGTLRFSFSWAGEKTFPRLGLLSLRNDAAEFSFMEEDVSGGVYAPLVLLSSSRMIPFISDFVDESRVSFLDLDSVTMRTSLVELPPSIEYAALDSGNVSLDLLSDSKKWLHPFYPKGVFLPFSDISLYDAYGDVSSKIMFPGVSFLTANPWDGTTAVFSLGVNPGNFFRSVQDDRFEAGLSATFSGGSTTTLFRYSLSPALIFDANGFMQASLSSSLRFELPVGNHSLIFSDDNFILFGRQHRVKLSTEESFFPKLTSIADDGNNYFRVNNVAYAVYSALRHTGSGYFEYGGFMAQIVYSLSFSRRFGDDLENASAEGFFQSLYPAVCVRAPKLIPVKCPYGMTYNLPFSVSAFLAPDSNCLCAANVRTVLFSLDIQKGLTFFPLYFNRFTVLASYDFGFYDRSDSVSIFNCLSKFKDFSSMSFSDTVTLSVGLEGALNTGSFASPQFVQVLGLDVKYYPRSGAKIPFEFALSTSLSL